MTNINEVKNKIVSKEIDGELLKLYCDNDKIELQRQRYLSLIDKFSQNFKQTEISIYSSPGRTEVAGNHTDHQHGRVIAASVNIDTLAIVSKRDDSIVHIVSEGFKISQIDLNDLAIKEEEIGKSEALIRGIVAGIKDLGYKIGGFDAYINSEVIEGAGLSSSASFEVLIGTIISGEYNQNEISPIEIAKIGQYSENVYFKKPCGLMDQMACSVGGFITIDFINPQSPIIEQIEFDFDKTNHSLCIVDTKGSHSDLTKEYSAIPKEMKKVSNYFGKEYLREVNVDDFYQNIKKLRKNCSDRAIIRACHFFDENNRVIKQVNYLKTEKFDDFKNSVKDSGNSSFKYLQNVYAFSEDNQQNISLALAVSEKALGNKGVARVHGGGFAGTIQAYLPNELQANYKEILESVFGKDSCHILKIRSVGGYKVI